MKKKDDLLKKILETTLVIEKEFPELSKYIDEMPVTIPKENEPHINATSLLEYQNSLEVLLSKYKLNHIK